MRPGGGPVLAALLLAASWFVPVAAQTSRPELTGIRFEGNQVFGDNALEGAIVNRATSCSNLFLSPLCWMGIEAAVDRRYLNPDELSRDALRLQAYYWLRGYRDARVEVVRDESEGGVALTFLVEEGEPVLVEELRIEGAEGVEAEGLLDDLPLAVGEPMSSLRIEAVRDTLVSRLREVGYAHADVFSGFLIPADSRAAEVDFIVDPGPQARFGEVRVEWAQEEPPELDETTVRRMVPFSDGGLYRFSQLVEGQRNLFALDLIQTARVTEDRDTLARDTVIPVNIHLTEGDLHRVRTGLGWSTADCFNGEARWTSRNFRGGARRLTARARISNILAPQLNETLLCGGVGSDEFTRLNGQLAVELIQPFVFSPRNSVAASAFVERQSVAGVYIREAIGTSLAFTRNIGRQATLTFSYQPALTRLDAGELFFCVSFLLCTAEDIEAFSSANWLSPLAVTLALNRSNRLLNPTAGYSVALDLEYASDWTGSDFVYARGLGEVAGYLGLGERTVLAARVRGGNVEPGAFKRGTGSGSVPADLVHPQKRFYAGGAASVRGFAENQLGPRVLSTEVENVLDVPEGSSEPLCLPEEVVDGSCDGTGVNPDEFLVRATGGIRLLEGSLELRFPLINNVLQGATFVDIGQVWDQQSDQELDRLEVTPGLGLRYFSPIGPLRIDVGYNFRGAQDLPLLTEGLEPCDLETGSCLVVRMADGSSGPIPWQVTDDLQPLGPRVEYGGREWYQRFQLHFSIGQAF
jgi:outer membrane protein insertion porin family/translocation and assembly module TamA